MGCQFVFFLLKREIFCVGLCLSEVRRHCPLNKYFSLYRWDPVTESNVPGGHIRIAFRYSCASDCLDADISDCRSSSSLDHLSVSSLGRGTGCSFGRSYDADVPSLPQRPVPTIQHVLHCSKSQQEVSNIHDIRQTETKLNWMQILSSTSTIVEAEITTPSSIETKITSNGEMLRKEATAPVQNSQVLSPDNNGLIHQLSDNLSEDKGERSLHHQSEKIARMSETRGLPGDAADGPERNAKRERAQKSAWFSVVWEKALGLFGAIAAITTRLFSGRMSKKHRSGTELVISEA